MTRHVIVGSGIAALSAAEAIRGADDTARIVVVSEERHPFYSRPGIAYLLTGALPAEQLAIRTQPSWEALRVERIAGRATAISASARALQMEDDRVVPLDQLLVATGARSITPPFTGAHVDGVVQLDGLDDAARIVARSRSGRTAIVVGGGSTALEMVEGFVARGMKVHYFLRGDRYWARVLSVEESRIVHARLEREGVTLHPFTEIASTIARDGVLRGVRTTEGREVACDLLAVATGVAPRLELARASGLAIDRGILVNERMETSLPGVFAAGDVAQLIDPVTGIASLDTLWSSASAMGQVAGRAMTGRPAHYTPRRPLNVTSLAGLVTTVVGDVGGEPDPDLVTITRGQSDRWSVGAPGQNVAAAQGEGSIRLRLSDHHIVGALIMGDQTLSEPLTQLITARADISPIRQQLLDAPGEIVPTLLRFHAAWRRRDMLEAREGADAPLVAR